MSGRNPQDDDEGTDPVVLLSVPVGESSLDEPTRAADGASLALLTLGAEVTVTRPQPGPERTVASGVRPLANAPAETTWAGEGLAQTLSIPDPTPTPRRFGMGAVGMDLSILTADLPTEEELRPPSMPAPVRLGPGPGRGGVGPPQELAQPRPSAPELELPTRPPPSERATASPEGAAASSRAPSPPASPKLAMEESRWGWWLFGVLLATLWLTLAGAVGWWVAERELGRAPDSAEP